jgi:arylsulfatase A
MSNRVRYVFALWACVVGSFTVSAETQLTEPLVKRPNIIVIYTDDQGFGDAGCYNQDSKIPTPNIDRLAREGMRFTDGHCSDTVCTPSRYGLLTGRYSWRTSLKNGVFGAERTGLISDDRITVASLLRDNGYATAMVGKWHLGMDFPGDEGSRDWSQPVQDMPLDKGFDYFFGVPASLNFGVLAWFENRFAKVPPTLYTDRKPNALNPGDFRIMPPYEPESKPGWIEIAPDFVDRECLTRFTDKAIAWTKEQAAAARDGKPFFLYLPYTSPHLPVIPLESFRGKSGCGAYGDFVMETDWHIGRILELLDTEKLADNTMILFSSDNGPENPWKKRIEEYQHFSSGPYRDGKRSIYEGGHRVPFIVRWPAQVAPGGVWDQPVCQTDLLATVADILAQTLPPNAGEDSASFLPVLTKGTIQKREPLIHHAANGRFAIRDQQWKLVMEHGNKQRELYDVVADPRETNNLIAEHSDVATELADSITAIVENGRSTPGEKQLNDTGWWSDLAWMSGEEANEVERKNQQKSSK